MDDLNELINSQSFGRIACIGPCCKDRGGNSLTLVLDDGKEIEVDSLTHSTSVEVYPVYKDAEGNSVSKEQANAPGVVLADYQRGKKTVVGSICTTASLLEALGVESTEEANAFDATFRGICANGGVAEQKIYSILLTQATGGKSVYDLGESFSYAFVAKAIKGWKVVKEPAPASEPDLSSLVDEEPPAAE